jgi:hypothetical protein
VFDEKITNRWRQEVSESGQDVTKSMMDWIIKELQWKTESLKDDAIVSVFDTGVFKSDSAISEELKAKLKEAVAPFENVTEDQKDYHPGSDNKVLDLVHPSLFPVVYGRTHILRDKVIGLDDCLINVGQGEVLPVPAKPKLPTDRWRGTPSLNALSLKFQWLPCDVELTGAETGCRIVSYITNVHPVEHNALYGVIEKIIDRTIPLWNKTLTEPSSLGERIEYGDDIRYVDGTEETEPTQGEDEDRVVYWKRHEVWQAARQYQLPEPCVDSFKPPNPLLPEDRIDLLEEFKDSGLQVIVKLANIELTPENPEYEGGSWHIEGQLVSLPVILYSSLGLILLRMNGFVQRPSTTTTAKTSRKAPFASAIGLEHASPTSSPTNKAVTNSFSRSTGSPGKEPTSETMPMA